MVFIHKVDYNFIFGECNIAEKEIIILNLKIYSKLYGVKCHYIRSRQSVLNKLYLYIHILFKDVYKRDL